MIKNPQQASIFLVPRTLTPRQKELRDWIERNCRSTDPKPETPTQATDSESQTIKKEA